MILRLYKQHRELYHAGYLESSRRPSGCGPVTATVVAIRCVPGHRVILDRAWPQEQIIAHDGAPVFRI
jgi:hypothetical protein